jgi:protoheme IX farnesyltransferase
MVGGSSRGVAARLSDYLELTKPGIVTMTVVTTAGGYYMAHAGALDLWRFGHTLAASMLLAAGACALNQYMERDVDALMERTRQRPVAAGRIGGASAFAFGLALALSGLAYLAAGVNLAAGAAGALALGSYILVYTPFKRVSSLSTLVGAVPGAMPPVIGWAAATDAMGFGAGVLFAIMFFWQIPHSLAIMAMYRDDYARAGLPLLPVIDRTGEATVRQSLVNAAALLMAGVMPSMVGMTGLVYAVGAVGLGLWFLYLNARWYLDPTRPWARRVFFGSLVYLMALFALLAVGKV